MSIMEVTTKSVTIKELNFDGSKLTKTKLPSIEVINHTSALEGLMHGGLVVLAKYPIQTYCKAIEVVRKATGMKLECPPKEELSHHAKSLCLNGVILYDEPNARLLNTWFSETEYATNSLTNLQKEFDSFNYAINTISSLNELSDEGVAELVRCLIPLLEHINDFDLIHYIELAKHSGLDVPFDHPLRRRLPQLTESESQEWYEDGRIIGISQYALQGEYLRQSNDWQELFSTKLDDEWSLNTLRSPRKELKSWQQTKQWLLETLEKEFDETDERLQDETRCYDYARTSFSDAPFIEIF
ncbi:TPA: hypothetical protein ACN331_002484 [Vibrio parahaemolyticus]